MNALRQAAHEYLTMRRSLGYKLRDEGKALLDFITFMERRRASYITHSLALAWAKQPPDMHPNKRARRLRCVRGFARHRSVTDPRTQIPPLGLLPYRLKRAQPYIYSDDEIKALLHAALKIPAKDSLRPWMYHCLFGLLSVTGLRVGEAQNLVMQDVDLQDGVLTIRGAKFGKSRLVPLHASTRRVLADYMARREQVWANRPVSSYLFVSGLGNRLDGGDIRRIFYALSRQIGLRGPSDSCGPRLHDMRHAFASKTLLRWYRAGENAEQRLPILAAYLGHVLWRDTFWY
jgi:integrase/recombinase XerD